jgi:hypothetical protein
MTYSYVCPECGIVYVVERSMFNAEVKPECVKCGSGHGSQVFIARRDFQGWRLWWGAVERMTPKDFKKLLGAR